MQKKKLRILQVYDSIAISSGISKVIISWMSNTDSEFVSIDVLACWKRVPDYEEEIINMGQSVYYIESRDHIENYFEFIKKVYNFFKIHAGDYDVVHLHSAIFSFPILSAAKKYGIDVRIVHVHSSALGNTVLSSLRNKIILIPMKIFANKFWACSLEAADIWFERIGIKNYFVINNGLEIEKYYRNNEIRIRYRNEWNVDDKSIIIGHVSNMSPIKNVPFLITVVHELIELGYDIKLVLIGKNELPVSVTDCIRENCLENYVINLGVRNDINFCVQAFDVCAMPSSAEGYGLVPIEVQLSGTPVMISDGFPSIISELPLSFTTKLDVDQWVNKFEKIMQNLKELQSGFDELTFHEFDINKIVTKVVNQYIYYLGDSKNVF